MQSENLNRIEQAGKEAERLAADYRAMTAEVRNMRRELEQLNKAVIAMLAKINGVEVAGSRHEQGR